MFGYGHPQPSVPPLPPAPASTAKTKIKSGANATKSKGSKGIKPKMTVIEKGIDMCMNLAKKNVAEGHRPFAAVIVPTESQEALYVSQGVHPLVGTADRVEQDCDPCAHAEIVAIRNACKKLNNFHIPGCVMYTSCEPCPMCLSAAYWTHIDAIYYGNTKQDAAKIDFDDSFIYKELQIPYEQRKIPMVNVMRDDAIIAFHLWQKKADKIKY